MQFAPKLLLTTLLCLTGARLAYCSQAQSSSAITTQAAPTVFAEQKQAVAQAVLQATGQDIVERDAKRVKLSAAEEQRKKRALYLQEQEREKNWVLSYVKKFSPKAEEKLEAAKIKVIENERGTILPTMLYDLLTCMPRELINLIASYDRPYCLEGELDQTFKIPLPKDVTITAITPLLVSHGTIVVVGYSNGYVQILKEQTDKEAKERWALKQTIQADKSTVTTIADLKDQKFATGATSGDLKIWTLKQNAKEYSCDATMTTGIPIKKIATLSNGNIVVGGTVGERSGQWQIWDPVTLKKKHSHSIRDSQADYPFIDLLVFPDDRIMINTDCQESGIYKQTKTNDWIEEALVKAPSGRHALRSLTLLPNNDILRCGYLGEDPDDNDKIQIHILDHNNYDHCSLFLQFDGDGEEDCGPITILSDGTVAVEYDADWSDAIKIFDMSDPLHQLSFKDDIIEINLPADPKREARLQYLITLPDGRLLGAFRDGTIGIWR